MGRAYSVDLRERVVAAVDGGGSCREAAEAFGVSVATVVRWAQRFRATGTVAPKPMGGHRPFALVNERDWLLARIAAVPDITVRALTAELLERDIVVSPYAVWHFLDHEGLSFKKKPARKRTGSP